MKTLKQINAVMKFCNDRNVACAFAGNTFTVYRDFYNGEHKDFPFTTVTKVIRKIEDYLN